MSATIFRNCFLGLVGIFLATPLLIVAGVSFNHNTLMIFPPQQAGLVWYRTFFSDPDWIAALDRSLGIGISAAFLAVSIATPICYLIWRFNIKTAKILYSLGLASFLLPPIVLAIAFLVFWSWTGYGGQIEDVVISHAIVFVALPLITVTLGFRSVDVALVEAGRMMGARESDIIRTIVFPIIAPYMVSGLIFVFVLSLNEYIIAYMVAGFTTETLPIKVFNSLRMGFQPTMCVGAVLFMLIGIAGFTAIAILADLPKLLGADR
jgi:putative spermidine/putrescine transport system permease protein